MNDKAEKPGKTKKDVGMLRRMRRFGLCRTVFVILLPSFVFFIAIRCTIYLVKMQNATRAAVRPGPRDCSPHPSSKSGEVNNGFPRLIHQTWKNKDIPSQWASSVQSCKNQNADYEYRLWTDEDLERFLLKEYPWFLETYNSYTYVIQKIDAARLFVLYHYGGIYMDLDIVCLVPWDRVLENRTRYDAILVETTPWGVTNYIMVAKPRDPFVWYLIEGLQDSHRKWYVIKYATVIFSTGPMMISDRLYTWSKPDTVQVINLKERDEVFGNLHGSSWHTWDGVIIYGFSKHYKLFLPLILFIIMLCVVTFYVLSKLYRTRLDLKRETSMLTEKQKRKLGLQV